MNACESILDSIGNTPLVRMKTSNGGRIYAKAEFLNPAGSIKDRVAKYIIDKAVANGDLKPGMGIIEATSGNTGIGVAFVGIQRGFRVVIVMPENMSEERKKIIRALGAELVETPSRRSLDGAIEKAREIKASDPSLWEMGQFTNPLNPEVHYRTTGPEIWDQTGGRVDSFVTGVGSGGTLAGVGKYLKEKNPAVRIVAVEPKNVSALLGHEPGLHQIQGIGDGFIPSVLDVRIINHVIEVTDDEAVAATRRLAREQGLLVGTSSGANMWAAAREAAFLGSGATVVTVLPDRAERYFSTSLI